MLKHVSTKMIIIFVILILPLNLIALRQSNEMIRSSTRQAINANNTIAEVYAEQLENRMENAMSLLHYLNTKNVDLIRMRTAVEKTTAYRISWYKLYVELKNMGSLITGADTYFYYMEMPDDLLVYQRKSMEQEEKEELLDLIRTDSIPLGWSIMEVGQGRRLVYLANVNHTFSGAWIELEPVAESIRESVGYQTTQILFSGLPAEETENELRSGADFRSMFLNILTDRDEVVRRISIYQYVLLGIAFLYLLLIPVLFGQVHRIFIRPLREVNDAHRRLEEGDIDYRLPEKAGSLEFEEANHSFNRMADHIRQLRIDVYEAELARQNLQLEKQEIELQNLQLQIRPHFLQNTFNLVYLLARKKAYEPIQKIVLYLSDYFRYIFRNGKELELFSRELQLIEMYVEVASIRYDKGIELHTDLDPEIEFVRVPPLLLHNFIENAVKYGYQTGKVLHIDLLGRIEENRVTFIVLDDGNGMSPEILEQNQKVFSGELIPENNGVHVGLYNSFRRLRRYYGEQACIEVESEPGEMTSFTITFPYNMGGRA